MLLFAERAAALGFTCEPTIPVIKGNLVISLREDNIEMLERMSCDEIVAFVEKTDDDYYAALPSVNDLAAMYGDKTSRGLFRVRDLFWIWQRRYRREYGLNLRDASDERYCCAIRS